MDLGTPYRDDALINTIASVWYVNGRTAGEFEKLQWKIVGRIRELEDDAE